MQKVAVDVGDGNVSHVIIREQPCSLEFDYHLSVGTVEGYTHLDDKSMRLKPVFSMITVNYNTLGIFVSKAVRCRAVIL